MSLPVTLSRDVILRLAHMAEMGGWDEVDVSTGEHAIDFVAWRDDIEDAVASGRVAPGGRTHLEEAA